MAEDIIPSVIWFLKHRPRAPHIFTFFFHNYVRIIQGIKRVFRITNFDLFPLGVRGENGGETFLPPSLSFPSLFLTTTFIT